MKMAPYLIPGNEARTALQKEALLREAKVCYAPLTFVLFFCHHLHLTPPHELVPVIRSCFCTCAYGSTLHASSPSLFVFELIVFRGM